MKYGIDYLLGAMYKRLVLDEHPNGFYAGFFMEEGGPLGNLPDRLFATNRCPGIRLQGLWDKDHNYESIPQFKQAHVLFEEAKELKRAWSNYDVQYSPFCEHDLDKKATRHLFNSLKASGTDGVTLVNSVNKGALIKMPGVINEIHNLNHPAPVGRFNHSFDGTDCFASNMDRAKKKYRRAEVMFFWAPPLNCKRKLIEKPFIPPMERDYRPSDGHIRTLSYYVNTRGRTTVSDGGILKPVAEESETPDVKNNKVCVIVPGKYDRLELRSNGFVYTLPYFGTFSGGGYRYYSKDWGYEIVEKLPVLPCRLVGIKRNGEKVLLGKVHPAFRCGSYRE